MLATPFNATEYNAQLATKTARITAQFAPFAPPALEVFASPISHYRFRCEFRIWHDDNKLSYAMFAKEGDTKRLIKLSEFAVASHAINKLMPVLLQALENDDCLRHKLFAVEFLSTTTNAMLVTLIYHKKLDSHWQAVATQLQTALNIQLIGRSRGQKLVLSDDFVLEKFTVAQQTFTYRQSDNGFSQPNAYICQTMLEWASTIAAKINAQAQQDLLELYCGNGNFTLPLAQFFRQVLATELAKVSVNDALANCALNNVTNIKLARLSAAEFSEAYAGVRQFRRLQEANIAIDDYEFSTIFVDPPRAGIDEQTLTLMATFTNILYISCNPDTLARDLQSLCQSHTIQKLALFDQFPYTHHCECGVWLKKNG